MEWIIFLVVIIHTFDTKAEIVELEWTLKGVANHSR